MTEARSSRAYRIPGSARTSAIAASAQLHEVNRPVVLVLPFGLHDLPLILVDLHDGTRPDDRKHGSVAEAYESVYAVAKVHMLDQPDRNLSPNLPQFREKI